MTEAIATVGSVVINVNDMETEKAFWTTLLGVGVARDIAGLFVWLEPQHPGGVSVALQVSDDPGEPAGRLHIDTGVPDIAEARATIEGLGGSHVEDHEIMGFRWAIMADPEGNRFCIAAEAE
jgi:predicted enzyme related to lactoylglutathione lyase